MGLMDDRTVVVTGGASGIGRAACELFAAEGARVMVADRDADGAEETTARVVANGGDAVAHEVDVTDEDQVQEMVATAVDRWGRLDAALNNAGIGDDARAFTKLSLEDWDRMIAVNLTSVFLCMKHELTQMTSQPDGDGGRGAIVNTASGASVVPAPGMPHYTAAKHGVMGLTKAAAQEYNSRGIRVNAVLPGVIDTPMTQGWFESSPGLSELVLGAIPGGRMGDPALVAQAAVWLCSDRAGWVSGESMVVDGGGLCR